jgi:polar amino acid transport system permease protein
MAFDWAYAGQILPDLLSAAVITVIATFGGMAVALVGGLLLAVARFSGKRVLSSLAVVYIEFFRSTPLLIQLYFLFYVLPVLGIEFNPLLTGVLGLGLNYSAYTAEVYRSGIEAIPRGQWEACTALNLSQLQTWARVIIPQAVPRVVPVLGNYLIGMFKDTALLSTITVRELLGTALQDASFSFRYLEPISLVGLIFLVLSFSGGRVVRQVEKRLVIR